MPDEVVIECVRDALQTRPGVAEYGFILDGFPRSVAQAEALNAILDELGMPVDYVISLEVCPTPCTRLCTRLGLGGWACLCHVSWDVPGGRPGAEGSGARA